MEPRGRAAQALSDRPRALTTSRIREAAACVFLLGLAMIQSPGLLVSDTKFDLAVAPAKFLARAGHLWDPMGALGQLQNQAYGYLFPMGPFFLLGSALDIPGWATQRLWMALVLCVAMLGAVRVAPALGVPSVLACLDAALGVGVASRPPHDAADHAATVVNMPPRKSRRLKPLAGGMGVSLDSEL